MYSFYNFLGVYNYFKIKNGLKSSTLGIILAVLVVHPNRDSNLPYVTASTSLLHASFDCKYRTISLC